MERGVNVNRKHLVDEILNRLRLYRGHHRNDAQGRALRIGLRLSEAGGAWNAPIILEMALSQFTLRRLRP